MKDNYIRHYLAEWLGPTKEQREAYNLWLWYSYHCESYDSKICTGSNEYEDYIPVSFHEHQKSYSNAKKNLDYINKKREKLRREGIEITNEEWKLAKEHFARFKLKHLKQEYMYIFETLKESDEI